MTDDKVKLDPDENIRKALGLLALEGYEIHKDGARLRLNSGGSRWDWVGVTKKDELTDERILAIAGSVPYIGEAVAYAFSEAQLIAFARLVRGE